MVPSGVEGERIRLRQGYGGTSRGEGEGKFFLTGFTGSTGLCCSGKGFNAECAEFWHYAAKFRRVLPQRVGE